MTFKLIIEQLKWQLEGADAEIDRSWKDVERERGYLTNYQERLNALLTKYTDSIARKEELRRALELLEAQGTK